MLALSSTPGLLQHPNEILRGLSKPVPFSLPVDLWLVIEKKDHKFGVRLRVKGQTRSSADNSPLVVNAMTVSRVDDRNRRMMFAWVLPRNYFSFQPVLVLFTPALQMMKDVEKERKRESDQGQINDLPIPKNMHRKV